jgi:hypothetical protein
MMRSTLKWMCVSAWALQLLLTVYYSVAMPRPFVAAGVDVTADLLHRLHLMYAWIGAGLGLALIGLRLRRWWVLTTIASSLTYLVVWYMRGPMALVGVVDGYRLLWQSAFRYGLYVSFLISDFLVPGTLILALTGAFFCAFRSDPKVVER